MSGKKYKDEPEGGFGTFLYNSDTGQILGRTCGSWMKITVFYIIFFCCLAAFFYACYQIFNTTIERPEENGAPKWTLDASLIGSNPGVGFRPMPDQDKNSESTLIWYRASNRGDVSFWTKQLADFVDNSRAPESANNVIECAYGNGAGKHRVCRVPTDKLGDCSKEKDFGYSVGKPCVLIKLNKIFEWEPEPFGVDENGNYNAGLLENELEELKTDEDEGMPQELKEHIMSEVKSHLGQEVDVLKTVWISCSGENVGDEENLPDSEIMYKPGKGIPGYFFPYMNQPNYKTPFVMVQLNIPQSSRHTLINIECRAWAKNIKYDRPNRLGSVHFEILVD